MKKVKCSHCHGTGEVTCSLCKGRGKRRCRDCNGSGHSCPVCSHGKVEKTRWINCEHCAGRGYGYVNGERRTCGRCDGRGQVKEKYSAICPNCHGDYQNEKYICRSCGGEGIVSCSKTERCSVCDGTGKVEKVSKCNLRLFRAFSMAFGFLGLQYLYVGRWLLFLLQFVMFVALGAVMLFLDPESSQLTSFAAQYGSDAKSAKLQIELVIWALLSLNLLLGIFLVKCDGKGGVLSNDYKRGWFWTFFVLCGFTGAHLAYMKERFLLGVHLIFVSCPTMFLLVCSRDSSSFDEFKRNVVAGIVGGFVAAFWELVLAKIVNAVFGTHFLDKDK